MMPRVLSRVLVRLTTAVALAGLASAGATSAGVTVRAEAQPATSATAHRLTNLDHLDFLLDSVPLLPGIAGHTTYRQAANPTARALWVYADHNADGSFTRVGGGAVTDQAKGWYGQGAFDADDIARAAVVYLRDWRASGSVSSRQHAYGLLRELTYLQTSSGPQVGNVVLWQQSDGTLNLTPTPADSPNPSDAAESFWLARTMWALGEGFAAFQHSDPSFAAFLDHRFQLALTALHRGSLSKVGRYEVVNGTRVPAWLIAGGTNATAEATLGLAAYVKAKPRNHAARTALAHEADGIAAMTSGGIGRWPYGAVLPVQNTRSLWTGWGGMSPAALAEASAVLHRPQLMKAAIPAVAQFTAQVLASGGPDQSWAPTPADTSQIAYGTDSLVESLLDAADVTKDQGLYTLAGVAAAWYFGANAAGATVYDPSTGVCADGIAADGTVNLNCGAESAIHTQLSMLALDAHPAVKAMATGLTHRGVVDGIRTVEAESGLLTGPARVVKPADAWTGTATWSGGAYVQAASGATLRIALPRGTGPANLYPVVNRGARPSGDTSWTVRTRRSGSPGRRLGRTANGGAGAQGISPSARALLPLSLSRSAPRRASSLIARVDGSVQIDAVLVQPVVSHLGLSGRRTSFDLYVNGSHRWQRQQIRVASTSTIRSYDSSGRLWRVRRQHRGTSSVQIPQGGFAVVQS